MNNLDRISGLFWFLISMSICLAAVKMGVGTLRSPGPGFIFFTAAAFLGFLSLILAISSAYKGKNKKEAIESWKGIQWQRGLAFIISLSIYSIFLTQLGYLISTFVLIGFLLRITKKPPIYIQWGAAFIITLLSYLIFAKWLEVQLPKGIISF
jgi:putative tricarboxylic transport membrane protein